MPTIVIGAGVAGLATAACLAGRGIATRLVDASGLPGGAYRVMYDGITLASPVSLLGLPGLPLEASAPYIPVSEYRAYLARYAAHHALTVERGRVARVARSGDGFQVTIDGAVRDARAVVVATGMFDFPIVPPLPGVDAVPSIHARDWRGPAAHGVDVGEPVVIVGGATAAVELAEELARAGRRPIVAARRKPKIVRQRILGRDLQEWLTAFERVPTWLYRRYCEDRPTIPATDLGFSDLRAQGKIDVRPAAVRVAGGEVHFADGSRAPARLVVFATGYRYDTPFLPPEVTRARAGHVRARHGESVSWPGLYLVGSPCASRFTSDLVRGVHLDSQDVAARIARRLKP